MLGWFAIFCIIGGLLKIHVHHIINVVFHLQVPIHSYIQNMATSYHLGMTILLKFKTKCYHLSTILDKNDKIRLLWAY